jgi:hypothetical protein
MKRIFGAIFIFSLLSVSGRSQLIISEYVEGSGNDKCIELYNTTSSPINLTGYSLRLYSNGSSAVSSTAALSGTIPGCGTFVICNGLADASLLAIANQTSGSINHNGDDAYDLYNGSSVLDVFGDIGCDPGTEWTSLGNGTADNVLRRSASVCSGVPDPTAGCSVNSFTSFTAANWISVNSTTDFSGFGSHTSSCGCASANTVTTGAVTGAPFSVDCLTNASGSVAFTSTGTFNAGNIYTVQLSDASGNFTAPVNIGTLASTANTGSINFTTPANTAAGAGYQVRIVSSDPFTIGTESAAFTINNVSPCASTGCPEIQAILVNACTAVEGRDEYIVFTTEGTSVNVNDISITTPSAGTWCNSGCGANTIVNQAAYITSLNTVAGCALFTYANPIPAGATVIVFTGTPPSYNMDFSSQCGSGPYYAVFMTNANTLGRFANAANADRTLSMTFGGSCSDNVTYYSSAGNTGTDGDFVYFEPDGTPSYDNDGTCVYPLPIELLSFTAKAQHSTTKLDWTTASELNSSHFEIERSGNGWDFEAFGSVTAAGNSSSLLHYSMIDDAPLTGVSYYRLKQVDLDGNFTYSGIQAVTHNASGFEIGDVSYGEEEVLVPLLGADDQTTFNVELYDLGGKRIYQTSQSSTMFAISRNQLPSGMYILKVDAGGAAQTAKVVIP